MKLVSTNLISLVPLEHFHKKPMGVYHGGLLKCQLKEITIIHSHMFVMELLHWHKVCELGGDKLHRPPMVALIWLFLLVSYRISMDYS